MKKRIRYCEWFTNFIQTKIVDILDVTFFTDEAWFHLSGYVNTQNTRLCLSENPHALHEKNLAWPETWSMGFDIQMAQCWPFIF